MSVTTPIVDFVRQYRQSGTSRLHMPGHKGQTFLGCEGADITEIAGADELYHAQGIIAESEANAARLFGTARTFYSTEGSSQCIRAMLFLALQAAPRTEKRPVLLAARNAHKALLYAAALLDIDIEWIWPASGAAGDLCACPVAQEQLLEALTRLDGQGRKPFGVYVTSPDYLGGLQDIAALSAVCRAAGTPLLVDNAHGAYLSFLPGGRHPIAQGAAMCCDSAHKTLPVLTGGAYLHLGPEAPILDEEAVRSALALFGSTSPSYLILQSLDRCNRTLSEGYPLLVVRTCAALALLRHELNDAAAAKGCPAPLVLDGPDREPLKLTLDAAALGQSGPELASALRAAGIECEYADPRYVVLMLTPENPPRDLERLHAALDGLLRTLDAPPAPLGQEDVLTSLAAEVQRYGTIRQAVFAPQERVSVDAALGRVCALPTVSCPPAIPVVVSGEVIGPTAVALMKRYGVEEIAVRRDLTK